LHIVTGTLVTRRVGLGLHAGCDKAEGVHPRGAVARYLHGGLPFQPLVSARMEECL
jgi:hypothetical protein